MDPSGYRKLCHAKQVIAKNYLLAMKEIPLRTLILDIHRQKAAGNLRGSTPAEEYKDYNSRLLGDEEYTKRLCSEFPEMNRLLQQQTEYFVSLLGEVLGRLEKDRQEIVDLFCGGRDFSQIRDLDSSIADSHNGGKRAVRLELDNGTILYYKPHSLKKNQNYQKLYRFLCEKAELGCCDVKYLDEGTYGWEENMEYQACSQEGEAERYYKRIGIHLCLGYALSASDLHGENIVAHGEFPIVVDLETFPGYATERSGKTAEEKAGKILAASVLKTGMLPTLSWGSGKDTVLLSAMGGKEKIVTPFKMPVIKNGGTSEICIAYDTVTMKMSGSVVRLGETVLNAGDYASFVCSGFRTAYQALLEETDAMALLEAFFLENSRVILRHTQQYAMYRFTSLHPDFCADGEKRRELLAVLYGKEEAEQKKAIHKYELECMMNMDIPYFELKGKSRSLFDGSGAEYENYLPDTPYQAWKRHMAEWNGADMERQLQFIRLSLAMLMPYGKQMKRAERKLQAREEQQKCLLETQIHRIADWLCRTAVAAGEDISWMSLQFYQDNRWRIVPQELYLYDGMAGTALFLAEYLNCFPNENVAAVLAKVKRKLFWHTEAQTERRTSGPQKTGTMDGEGSLVYAYLLLYRITREQEYLDHAELQFSLLDKAWEEDQIYDFIGGNAGAIYMAALLYEETGKEQYRKQAAEIEKILWSRSVSMQTGAGWITGGGKVPLSGMAHGNSGFLRAYAALYRITGEAGYREKIEALLQYEDSLYSEELQNWADLRWTEEKGARKMNAWCHGAPGILLSRMELQDAMPSEAVKRDIKLAGEALFTQPAGSHICLCHGLAGNLLIMKYCLPTENRPAWKERYETELSDFLNLLQKDDGLPTYEHDTPGFMNGMAGVGFALLQLCR
ncbi:MAG: type 2 lanthipeptide synthetase LanM [Lachnospiraceae bacterium]|nr:type 2 lanthipeptide synthetase LanM [Lachnospiraceae bacterium]